MSIAIPPLESFPSLKRKGRAIRSFAYASGSETCNRSARRSSTFLTARTINGASECSGQGQQAESQLTQCSQIRRRLFNRYGRTHLLRTPWIASISSGKKYSIPHHFPRGAQGGPPGGHSTQ